MSLLLAITLSLTGALVAAARPAHASKHRKNRKPPAKPAPVAAPAGPQAAAPAGSQVAPPAGPQAAAPAGPQAAPVEDPVERLPPGRVDTTLDFPDPKERFPRPSGIPPTRMAKELLREQAAALGPCDIGVSPVTGPDGRPLEPTINVKRAIEGALQGNPKAQLQVSLFYDYGLALPKDERLAMAWIMVACDLGDPEAFYTCGMKYFGGQGVPKDMDKGLEMTMLAALKGFPEARHNIWRSHKMNGAPGFDFAFDQLKLAAEVGHPEAMHDLAYCHLEGDGVPVNRELGERWLRRAEKARRRREEAKLSRP